MDYGENHLHAEIEALRKQRKRLESAYHGYKKAEGNGRDNAFFWGSFGLAGVLLDVTLMGTFGAAFLTMNGVKWVLNSKFSRDVEKRLTDTQGKIDDLVDMSINLNQKIQADQSLSTEFSPAARKQIDELKQELGELKKMISNEAARKKIDKPPYDKPGF